MGLMADLGRGPAGVDTVIFIYFIEEHPRFLPLLEPLFREVDEGRRELATSALTLLEVLVVPYRSGDHLLAGRYEALLTRSRGIRVAEISRDQLRAAAQLREATGVKAPDSLQLVAAWPPAAPLFSRMIVSFRTCPASVFCNYLPTLRDLAGRAKALGICPGRHHQSELHHQHLGDGEPMSPPALRSAAPQLHAKKNSALLSSYCGAACSPRPARTRTRAD